MSETRHRSLGRHLTPEEGERYRKIAQAAEQENPAACKRLEEQGYVGHLTREDVQEVVRLGAFLRSERERLGMDLTEVARRCSARAEDLQALEEGRFSEPPVSLLTRYARAVGKSLMLGLRQAEASPGRSENEQLAGAAP